MADGWMPLTTSIPTETNPVAAGDPSLSASILLSATREAYDFEEGLNQLSCPNLAFQCTIITQHLIHRFWKKTI